MEGREGKRERRRQSDRKTDRDRSPFFFRSQRYYKQINIQLKIIYDDTKTHID